MLCTCIYLGHASLTTIRRDFGHEFTVGKFPNPPKFVVDLPQSVLECVFNAQVRARDFDYFPLILFVLCSLCMRMIRFECLGHVGWIFMAHLLSRQYVSFPVKPLDLMQ